MIVELFSGYIKSRKYTSPEIQNQILEIMSLKILHNLASQIRKATFYSIMGDECTDISNKEQFALCFRSVDYDIYVHEDFFGLYQVPDITADTLVLAIKDMLIRINLSLQQCRGQCYDGVTNMSGNLGGVVNQITNEEKRALFCHCNGYSLNLAASDAIKGCKVMSDALDTIFEILKSLKFSPKCEHILQI